MAKIGPILTIFGAKKDDFDSKSVGNTGSTQMAIINFEGNQCLRQKVLNENCLDELENR